jgi:hypothetical protein
MTTKGFWSFSTPSYGKLIRPPITYFDDFSTGQRTIVDAALASETDPAAKFLSGFSANSTQEWAVSHDTVVAATQLWTETSADGGRVVATTDATAGERISMQRTPTILIPTATAITKYAVQWETRLNVTNITCDAYVGLAVANATDPHASRPLGALAFTLTGDGDIEVVTANGSTSTASIDTDKNIVAATDVYLGIWCDGTRADFFVNGEKVYRTSTTLPNGLLLGEVFCIESNGVAETMSVDYVLTTRDRS